MPVFVTMHHFEHALPLPLQAGRTSVGVFPLRIDDVDLEPNISRSDPETIGVARARQLGYELPIRGGVTDAVGRHAFLVHRGNELRRALAADPIIALTSI